MRRAGRRPGVPAARGPQSEALRLQESSRRASCGCVAPVGGRPTSLHPAPRSGLSSVGDYDPGHGTALTRCARAARLRPSDAGARFRARCPALSGAACGGAERRPRRMTPPYVTNVPPSRGSKVCTWIALIPNDVPVQAIRRSGSTSWMVDVIVPGPAFQRNAEPGPISPSNETDLTAGFQFGQRPIAVRTSQATSGAAAISISLDPTTGARSLISHWIACRLSHRVASSPGAGAALSAKRQRSFRTACWRALHRGGASASGRRGSRASG